MRVLRKPPREVVILDFNAILSQIKESCIKLLKDNLVGIYVHGSIAFDCFNPNKSDIDYIIVINRLVSAELKTVLIKETFRIEKNAPPKGLEMSVVLKENCVNFKYPTPFELHYSKAHEERAESNISEYCKNMNGVDKDLAAHFTVIKKAGIILYGEDIDSVFGEVPEEDYFDSIKSDIQNAQAEIIENPVYVILNLCRVLAYKKAKLILSKEQGGNWGLENLAFKYNSVIKTALDDYYSDKPIKFDKNTALNFCDYMLNQIFKN